MNQQITTDRLLINELDLTDAPFILDLVNTPGWLRFIGDRNVKTISDAAAYIQKILDNQAIDYWTIRLSGQRLPIGIISFIKRDYLEHKDIGFAFHPNYEGKGYAYEATNAVLKKISQQQVEKEILATVAKDNKNSIKLLEKLGLKYSRDIQVEDRDLFLYSMKTLESAEGVKSL